MIKQQEKEDFIKKHGKDWYNLCHEMLGYIEILDDEGLLEHLKDDRVSRDE